MGFSIERAGDVSTVRIIDELITEDRPELRRAILGELADGASVLRIDFADANYIDGAGLGLLVSLSRLAREHTAEMRLANLNDDLRGLFTLTKLEMLFTIERSEAVADDAVANPSRSAPPRDGPEHRPRP
ncbi:MAG TPA: STAS domain-containing protein [Gemmatimonadaceae bacterium]|nr:STAS domain-containing protein [Gemmatimonadaceae bacterium]